MAAKEPNVGALGEMDVDREEAPAGHDAARRTEPTPHWPTILPSWP